MGAVKQPREYYIRRDVLIDSICQCVRHSTDEELNNITTDSFGISVLGRPPNQEKSHLHIKEEFGGAYSNVIKHIKTLK